MGRGFRLGVDPRAIYISLDAANYRLCFRLGHYMVVKAISKSIIVINPSEFKSKRGFHGGGIPGPKYCKICIS